MDASLNAIGKLLCIVCWIVECALLHLFQLHMHEEDVHALIMLGVAASRISEVVATHPEPVTTTSFRSKGDDLSAIEQQKLRTSRAGTKNIDFTQKNRYN